MAVNVETLDKLERKITLTLPVTVIQSEVDSRLKRLARTVKMDGFRPGKVPMNVVAQRYGYSVHYEVMNDKVGEAFAQAANEAKLRVAGQPKITEKEQSPGGRTGVRRRVRGVPGSEDRRPGHRRSREAQRRGERQRHRQDPGNPAQAAPHLRPASARRRSRRGRPRHGRLRGQDRRRTVPGRQGRGLPVRGGRRPDAQGIRGSRARHEDRREQDLPAGLPGRLPRQGRGGQAGRLHGHHQEDRSRPPAGSQRGAGQVAGHRRPDGGRPARRHPQEPRARSQVPPAGAQQAGCHGRPGLPRPSWTCPSRASRPRSIA